MGRLPQRIEANLRTFEQLRQQLQAVTEKEGKEENRRAILGGQIGMHRLDLFKSMVYLCNRCRQHGVPP